MNLREIVVYADERIVERYKGGFVSRFHTESCCITELLRRLLKSIKIQTGDDDKIVLTFTDEAWTEPEQVFPLAGVLWPFDFQRYLLTHDNRAKKVMFAEAVRDAVLWIAKQKEWETSPLLELYAECLRQDLTLSGISKKAWASPTKKWKVRVFFEFELTGVELFAVLFRNRENDEHSRVYLGRGLAETGCLNDYLTDGNWLSESLFELRSQSFIQERWRADFSTRVDSD